MTWVVDNRVFVLGRSYIVAAVLWLSYPKKVGVGDWTPTPTWYDRRATDPRQGGSWILTWVVSSGRGPFAGDIFAESLSFVHAVAVLKGIGGCQVFRPLLSKSTQILKKIKRY